MNTYYRSCDAAWAPAAAYPPVFRSCLSGLTVGYINFNTPNYVSSGPSQTPGFDRKASTTGSREPDDFPRIIMGQTLLHDDILRAAAQPALKGLLARCLSVILKFGDVMDLLDDNDAKPLVETFDDLQKDGFRESDIARLYNYKLFDDYSEIYLTELKSEGLLILSLVTWQFDASLHILSKTFLPPPNLLEYFSTSKDDGELCEILWARYNQYSAQRITSEDFKEMFVRLCGLLENGFLRLLFPRY
ncbi:hypothetical protein FE257_005800 [Aspergillus nanangensis]|uniref:Uncharacterized protein n=1 Tax=Aspergillus nanangensis TaxID=2582783 RepID=A0AAD4CAE2_ASPNN|nr:hypothetical protein FE257_005800 [Aspergillus nanangensis]